MLASGEEGYILNTGSVAGMVTGPFFAPYNASKHAVVSLSECLHHELRAIDSKIQVGVLCPGWVNTGLADFESKLPDELRAGERRGRHAPGRRGAGSRGAQDRVGVRRSRARSPRSSSRR